MHHEVLRPEIQEFIVQNTGVDVTRLALSKNPFPDVEWQKILQQVAGRTKAKHKLPTWFNQTEILYPSRISIEQTSSETTAAYKSGLVSAKTLIDLSGGFGVDAYYFSKNAESVVHCELDPELSAIAAHNANLLGAHNLTFYNGDGTQALSGKKFDWIYVDPSRRSESKGKVFLLGDCIPNVPELLKTYLEHAPNILIKTAPLLDISSALHELRHVCELHVVAVENEVKELLWRIASGYNGSVAIKTINFIKDSQELFSFDLDAQFEAHYDLPLRYLYEPNAAIMKAGGFDAVSAKFNISKLHRHSHLYTSDQRIAGFPGRTFEIKERLSYTKSDMSRYLKDTKANITVRNFPDKVEVIRKKYRISDGGQQYCFFTTDLNERKIVLICTKI